MARIRTLKPDFFRSPDTAKADFPVRIFYQALWCWADDFGVGETNINGLLGFAFPDDDEFTAQDVRRFCADCAQHFGVAFYAVSGRHYYAIPSWEKHQKLERRTERRKNPGPDDPNAVPDQRFHGCADSAPEMWRERRAKTVLEGEQGKGNRGRGTGEDEAPLPPEPPPGPYDAQATEIVVDNPPASIEIANRPAKAQPSSAAKTVVRQELGGANYPNATVDRLATQVEKLIREQQPDQLIREALREWDRRPNCSKPEFLPTVLGDVIKASRSADTLTAGESKVMGWAALAPISNGPKAINQ